MNAQTAASALLDALALPGDAANVLVWHATEPPTLRVWVERRYLWHVRRTAPPVFDGFRVEVEERPAITAH